VVGWTRGGDRIPVRGHLLRVDDGVIEQFALQVAGSVRVPLAWASAYLEPRKNDMLRVQIGTNTDSGAPFYSTPSFASGAFMFVVPVAEEPQLRAFLDQAALASGPTA
jgi:hypothetical protein